MRPTALTATTVGLVGTSAVHLWQYVVRYAEAPNGWLFLVQATAAAVLVGLVLVSRHGVAAPAAAAALQLGSLVAIGMAYTTSFLGFTEVALRPATVITILAGVVGLAGAAAMVVQNVRSADDGASVRELMVG